MNRRDGIPHSMPVMASTVLEYEQRGDKAYDTTGLGRAYSHNSPNF
jgi:hypothetical protein